MSTAKFDTWQKGDGTRTYAPVHTWVNFNGTGTVTIRASLNVTSITDNGTGDYTINFTTALANTNYTTTTFGTRDTTGNFPALPTFTNGQTKTTAANRINNTVTGSSSVQDNPDIMVIIVGGI